VGMFCRWRTEALSAGHRDNKMNKPLTDEQIWGVPAEQLPSREPRNFFGDFIDIYGEPIEIPDEVKDGSSEEKEQF